MRGGLTSLMSSSSSAGLQSMSVISPELVVVAMAITELLPSEGGRRRHYGSVHGTNLVVSSQTAFSLFIVVARTIQISVMGHQCWLSGPQLFC